MTVHVVMPVHNRLEMTRKMISCLRAQQVDEPLSPIVVNDGSTDGTAEYLSSQPDLIVIPGNGCLWWGGAVEKALRHVFDIAHPADWALLVNNDTCFDSGFAQCLLNAARQNGHAAVGSVIRHVEPPHRLMSIGGSIDHRRLIVRDRIEGWGEDARFPEDKLWEVDVLSGRGTLYAVSALKKAGGMCPRWAPHYLADYELSLRVRAAGFHLLVAQKAVVYSDNAGHNVQARLSLASKLWSLRSPSYLPAKVRFWWTASSWTQRLTLPLRALIFVLLPGLRRT